MKMKVMYNGKLVNAKRFKDLTEDQVRYSTANYDAWEGEEIFVEPSEGLTEWIYMYDHEVEIISE